MASRHDKANEQSLRVPLEYGWCQCGLLQCGRPYHGDFEQTTGPSGHCAQRERYNRHIYNPAENVMAPTYDTCQPGDRVCVLVNARAVLSFGALPEWHAARIFSISFEGFVQDNMLTIMLVLKLRTATGIFQNIRMSLWEPGITAAALHLGGMPRHIRPVVILARRRPQTAMARFRSADGAN